MIRPLFIIWISLLLLKGAIGFGFSWGWVIGFFLADLLTFFLPGLLIKTRRNRG